MRAEGIEPPRSLEHRVLGPVCLPVPARPLDARVLWASTDNRRARLRKILDLRGMAVMATELREGYEIWRPNREKAESRTTKALVSLILLISAGLLAVITIGGWQRLQGASVVVMSLGWAILYVVFALLVARWNRGILPIASA